MSERRRVAKRVAKRALGCDSAGEAHEAGGGQWARLSELDRQRRALRYSQVELARALGVSAHSLGRVLRGEPVRRGPGRTLCTPEGIQRIEIALHLYARSARKAHQRAPRAERHPRTTVPAPTVPTAPSRAVSGADTVVPSRSARMPIPVDARRPVRLLIVEDDLATVELYRLVLAEEHEVEYQVDIARTAVECLERLEATYERDPYDILLMDFGVADVRSGLGHTSLLARFERTPALLPRSVLVVSGISPYHYQLKREQMLSIGAAFVAKPFDIDELLQTLRALAYPQPLAPRDTQPALG